jgi:hypothetical protein
MTLGPVELLVVAFPGNRFKGEIVPELQTLVENGTIRVIDLLFVKKDERGTVEAIELNDQDDETFAPFDPIVEELDGLLSSEDVQQFAAMLENNSSAALMLFENTWATRFRDAVLNAGGKLVLNERIPKAVMDELLADTPAPVA